MKEEFLQFIWQFGLFDKSGLTCTDGNSAEIIHQGKSNRDSGPDFINARIRIGDTLWAGNAEIHVNSSDWAKHNHSIDKSYDNIIAHIVYNHDTDVSRPSGEIIPTICLNGRIAKKHIDNYNNLLNSKDWVPCGKQISAVPSHILISWLDRIIATRIERRSEEILSLLSSQKNNWEETFYIILARNFGFKINSLPFELLAKSMPQTILAKHKSNEMQINALIFGQSGLLSHNFTDAYPLKLKAEYEYLKIKLGLQPLEGHLWKYMRLRPPNFPEIRLSQFASLIYKSSSLFSKILSIKNINDIYSLFDTETNEYWKTHYRFDSAVKPKSNKIGVTSVDNIIINTIVPMLYIYGNEHDEKRFKILAYELLSNIKAEDNVIIRKWNELSITVKNSYESQAMLELKNEYCNKKQCLSCGVGNYLVKS